jgi:acetylglutamate kinase
MQGSDMESLTVIKIGGNVIDDDDVFEDCLNKIARAQTPIVLVHGGGKIATTVGERLGVQAVMIEGRRVTDKATLEIVTMVYGGLVNKRIVAGLQARGVNALGLSGADGDLVRARKRPVGEIDYGFVGDIERVREERLRRLLETGFTPVFAPLAHDGAGAMLNVNADTVASEIAAALAATRSVRLLYCFDKPGVLRAPDDDASLIPRLDAKEYESLRASGAIAKGMIPKLDNAFAALRRGVFSVSIAGLEALENIENNINSHPRRYGTAVVLEAL